MKAILIATLLAFALADGLYFRTPEVKPISDLAPPCITDYLTSFWAHFGLAQPTQALACFNDETSVLYFAHIYEFASLVSLAESRSKIEVHIEWAKIILTDKALMPVHACMARTQDFADLLKALNVENITPAWDAISKFIYYQANFGKLTGIMPQITGALSNNNFTGAGDLSGALVNCTMNEIAQEGVALLALKGLWNGVHIALGLPDAASILSCWNNDTATIRLEFIYGLSVVVANGSINEAAQNTQNWYNQTGNALIAQIPASAWQCWANSTDTQSESANLGVDVTSQAFFQQVNNFVQKDQAIYWLLQKGIKASLEQHNFLHAGSFYGHLWQAAVKLG